MTILPWILILSLFFIHKFYSLQYYSNFNDGKLLFGIESTIVDYVTLANDPKENLPNDFTICTSLYIKYMTTKNNIFELYKEDGSHWFQMDIEHLRDIDSFSERISMFYESTLNKFWDKTVTIIPHSWYHVCLGLDTDSGHLRLVVNGNVLVDEVKEFFVQTSNLKPTSLAGKLLGIVDNEHLKTFNFMFSVFKTYHNGYWYQTRNTFSNINIFGSMISVEQMVKRTSGEDCSSPGDYLG